MISPLDFLLQILKYMAIAIGIAIGLTLVILAAISGWVEGQNRPPTPMRKRYVMRGYGGGKNATSLHPRQAKQGKRIVYIPGVGYRHVQPGKRKQR